jgi:Tfp pilus assembly protein PilV
MPVDLSLYLVTDATPAILKGRDLCEVVESALKGGQSCPKMSVNHSTNSPARRDGGAISGQVQ